MTSIHEHYGVVCGPEADDEQSTEQSIRMVDCDLVRPAFRRAFSRRRL